MTESENKDKERQYFENKIGKFIKFFVDINGYKYTYSGKLLEVWEDKILIDDVKVGEVPISFDQITVLNVSDKAIVPKRQTWRNN